MILSDTSYTNCGNWWLIVTFVLMAIPILNQKNMRTGTSKRGKKSDGRNIWFFSWRILQQFSSCHAKPFRAILIIWIIEVQHVPNFFRHFQMSTCKVQAESCLDRSWWMMKDTYDWPLLLPPVFDVHWESNVAFDLGEVCFFEVFEERSILLILLRCSYKDASPAQKAVSWLRLHAIVWIGALGL